MIPTLCRCPSAATEICTWMSLQHIISSAKAILDWKVIAAYLVLVLQPASCCSRMRAASCCWSATSLPWACLMKGCSRRWVTDGRASKSFIRHLGDHKVTEKKIKHFRQSKPTWTREKLKGGNCVSTWALQQADLSGLDPTSAWNTLQVF